VETTQTENIKIRPYRPSDLESLYKICLLTGDSGKDASDIYEDPKLLGHFYAAPYAVLEPELTFIVTLNKQPSGYILGTRNSEGFRKRSESEWFPNLRQQYPLPKEDDISADANIIRLIYKGYILKKELADYPAHLHVDLLPNIQGKGLGKKVMLTFIDNLRQLKVSALHLEVGKKNLGAIGFYKKMGFHKIIEYEHSIAFGIILNS
jgi:ribosomal protein S18 acetylase RimI-like enzyme